MAISKTKKSSFQQHAAEMDEYAAAMKKLAGLAQQKVTVQKVALEPVPTGWESTYVDVNPYADPLPQQNVVIDPKYVVLTASAITAPKAEPVTVKPLICIKCNVALCTICGLCEEATCALIGRAITSKSDLISLRHLMANTQKARGYGIIAECLNVPSPYRVIITDEDIDTTVRKMVLPTGGLFIRPCPVRPRHGFVDSRTVKGTHDQIIKEVHKIYAEAIAADPEAELLITPTIAATYSAILTPTKMAVGTGNDGATAGRKSALFPLTGVPFAELSPTIAQRAGVNIATEDPYIEAVMTNDIHDVYASYSGKMKTEGVYFTQLRAGARIPPAVDRDFIPERTMVDKVIEASGDLLEWERQVKMIVPGTVVYHLGGTLVSHYGVHCIFHNVPILTSRKPEVGEVLIPTARPDRPTPEAVVKGIGVGTSALIGLTLKGKYFPDPTCPVKITCSEASAILLVAAHNAAAMGGDHGTWLGVATTLMMRLGMAASHGEARHKGGGGSREYVYGLALNDFFESRDTLGWAQWRFKNLSWSSSFGGPKWAKCTTSILELDEAVRGLMAVPSDDTVTALVTKLHNAINQAHNGGWWLNKFVGQEIFDDTSKQGMYSLCTAAPGILQISGVIGNPLQEVMITEAVEKYKALSAIKVEQPAADASTMKTADPVKLEATNDSDHDEEDDPELDYEDSDNDPDNESNGICGDPSCTTCNPSGVGGLKVANSNKKKNINGTPLTAESKLFDVQGRLGQTGAHIQFKVENLSGYFSFDVEYEKTPLTVEEFALFASKQTKYSFSGSGSMYTPLPEVTQMGSVWYIDVLPTLTIAYDVLTTVSKATVAPKMKEKEAELAKV